MSVSVSVSVSVQVAQGFGAVHLSRPSLSDVPDVFYPRFIAEQEQWDTDTWVRKPRPVDVCVCGVFFDRGKSMCGVATPSPMSATAQGAAPCAHVCVGWCYYRG